MEEEWTELFSEKHQKKYWKNKASGQTTWKNPLGENASHASRPKSPAPATATTGDAAVTAKTSAGGADEWQELFSEKHQKKYWKNKTTGQTSWKAPAVNTSNAAAADCTDIAKDTTVEVSTKGSVAVTANSAVAEGSEEWEELFSQKHNRKYWKNKASGKTSWTKPETSGAKEGTATEGATAPTSSATAPVPLASTDSAKVEDEWTESFSEKHNRKYWKNKVTGKTSWTKPETENKAVAAPVAAAAPVSAAVSALSAASVTDEWEEKFSDKHNRKYWRHKVTGKTSWTAPTAEVKPVASAPPTAATSPVNVPSVVAVEEEWEELFNQKHNRKYWKNKTTGKTSWTKPEVKAATPVAVAVAGIPALTLAATENIEHDWVESFSEKHKRKYWKNKTTGKTSWTDPTAGATPRSVAPSAPVSAAPSAAPSTVASPLTVSSDVAKVAENKATLRSTCSIQDPSASHQLLPGSHFLEILIGEQDMVVRTMQIQHQSVVTDTAEGILPSMEHFPEKGCGVLDEWGTGSMEVHSSAIRTPFSAVTLKKQTDADQGIVINTNLLVPGISVLPKLLQSHANPTVLPEKLKSDFLQNYGRFPEAYETARALGSLIELEAAFAVGDSSSYKLLVPESNLTAELEGKENAVLFHLTDYKKLQLHNESLHQPESDKFPTSGILPIKVFQHYGKSTPSISKGANLSSSHNFSTKAELASPVRWMPCWIDVDMQRRCVHFHEQGPKLPATFTLSCEGASVSCSDIAVERKTYELEVSCCTMIATVTGSLPAENKSYGVHMNFASQDELTAWYYTFTLCTYGEFPQSKGDFTTGAFSPLVLPSQTRSVVPEEEDVDRPSCSDKLLQLEKSLADKHLALLNLRILEITSMQLKSMKLQVSGGRVIVQAQGKCKRIPAGSIILSMNGVSAVDLPTHMVMKFVTDLPKSMMVNVTFLRPVSVQYSAEMMLSATSPNKPKSFTLAADSPFSPKKTLPSSSNHREINNNLSVVDPIAAKIVNQIAFDEFATWSSCQLLLLGDVLSVIYTDTATGQKVAHRLPLSSTVLKLSRSSSSTVNNAATMSMVSSIFIELSYDQLHLRVRVPVRAQFHAMLRSLIAAMKLYGSIKWELDVIRSLNEHVAVQWHRSPQEQDNDESPRDITNVSVLLSQSQIESDSNFHNASFDYDHPDHQILPQNDIDASIMSVMMKGNSSMSVDDHGSVGGGHGNSSLPPPQPVKHTTEESVIDAAESLQNLLQSLHLPTQFPTATMIEKIRLDMRGYARKNVQLMANVLTAQVEACYPASAFNKMSIPHRDSEMADEIKENDGANNEESDTAMTNNAVNFEETLTGSYMDGDNDANNGGMTLPAAASRRRASVNSSSTTNSSAMDAMQQRQFNKAARRASRLSINMDMAAVQMFSMGGTTPTPLSTTTSTLNRTTLKNAAKLSTEERSAISVLFHHFRSHPDDLLLLSGKLTTFQDMLSFAFIVVQRLYSPLSTDQGAVEGLLKSAFQVRQQQSSDMNQNTHFLAHHHAERVPFFAHENRVLQSFDDFAQNIHQKLMFSHKKYSFSEVNGVPSSTTSHGLNKITLCILYELYCRPEVIAFLEALVPRLTTDTLSPDSGVADMCSKIVEPICTRLHDATERKLVPPLLKVVLRAIHRHSNNLIHAEDFLSVILTPYVCNSLVDGQVQRGFLMDPASQQVVNRARDLLFACFDQSLGKKLQLSLSDSAALSRSRWFISRTMEVLVEDDRPFPSSGVGKLVLSPVARLCNMRPETNRPQAIESFICLKPSELLYMLKMFDLSSLATSLMISTSRAVSESMSVLSASDLVTKLNGYVIINAAATAPTANGNNNGSNTAVVGSTTMVPGGSNMSVTSSSTAPISGANALLSANRRTYMPTVLDRDVVYIFDLDEDEKDKDPLLDLLDEDDLLAGTGSEQVRSFFDVGSSLTAMVGGSVGGGNASSANNGGSSGGHLLMSEEDSAAANELHVINWLLNAARTSLKHVFDHVTKVHSISTVRELHELRDKLRAKLPLIRAILSDWQALQASQELLRCHQAQVTLLQDVYKSRKSKGEFFKGPLTMMGPPALLPSSANPAEFPLIGGTSASSTTNNSSSSRFPVLIAATRMIYVDHLEVRPITLAAAIDEDKEYSLVRLLQQHMQLETRLSLQRLSEALQPSGMLSSSQVANNNTSRTLSNSSNNSYNGHGPAHNNAFASTTPHRSSRNMNPLLVIMQNVFPASDIAH